MGYYRKKPKVIEAIQFDGTEAAVSALCIAYPNEVEPEYFPDTTKWTGNLVIKTLEGLMLARPGWWIITGVHGEKYPCAPDIFEETYEMVAPSPKENY